LLLQQDLKCEQDIKMMQTVGIKHYRWVGHKQEPSSSVVNTHTVTVTVIWLKT